MVHNQTSITTLYPSFGEVRAVVFFELNGDEYLSFSVSLTGNDPFGWHSQLSKRCR